MGLVGDLDEDLWKLAESYVLYVFEPALATQPFQFTKRYTQQLATLTLDAKLLLARKMFTRTFSEPKNRGLVFMHRIMFGLGSLLTALRAQSDWRSLMKRAG